MTIRSRKMTLNCLPELNGTCTRAPAANAKENLIMIILGVVQVYVYHPIIQITNNPK